MDDFWDDLFAQLRAETIREVDSRLGSFGKFGDFRRVLNSSRIVDKFRDRYATLISGTLSLKSKAAALLLSTFTRKVESLVDQVNVAVSKLAELSVTVDEFRQDVRGLEVFDRASSWSDDDLFALQTVSEFVDRRSSASFKVWRTVKDVRVRDSHDHAEGQRVRVDDYFVLGSGARCLFPLDGSLPVEDIVNCRCYLEYQ